MTDTKCKDNHPYKIRARIRGFEFEGEIVSRDADSRGVKLRVRDSIGNDRIVRPEDPRHEVLTDDWREVA